MSKIRCERPFRLVSNGVRYRIEVFDHWWCGFGEKRWRRTFHARIEDVFRATRMIDEMRREEKARCTWYAPVEESYPARPAASPLPPSPQFPPNRVVREGERPPPRRENPGR
jgi:hypothetical protein